MKTVNIKGKEYGHCNVDQCCEYNTCDCPEGDTARGVLQIPGETHPDFNSGHCREEDCEYCPEAHTF